MMEKHKKRFRYIHYDSYFEEISQAISDIKILKAASSEGIYPEFPTNWVLDRKILRRHTWDRHNTTSV